MRVASYIVSNGCVWRGPCVIYVTTQAKGSCKLRGKAAEIKHFTRVVLRVWQEHCNPMLHTHKLISACLRASVAMEDIIDEHKEMYALPGDCLYISSTLKVAWPCIYRCVACVVLHICNQRKTHLSIYDTRVCA